jgi:hypothetical protein
MVKCGVLFEVRSEFLNIIYKSFGFRGLKTTCLSITIDIPIAVRTLVLIIDIEGA